MEAKRRIVGVLALSAIIFGGVASLGVAESRPARPEAALRRGKVRGFFGTISDWTVSAFGREGSRRQPKDGRRPCLEARIETRIRHNARGFHTIAGCYGPGYTTPTSEPLIAVAEMQGSTVVGLAFAPTVTALEASFADDTEETIDLRQLKPRAAKRIARERFRYAAFAVKGRWCPSHLVALDAAGQRLWERDEQGCLASSGAPEWREAMS